MANNTPTMTSEQLLQIMNDTFGPDWMKSLDGQSTPPFGLSSNPYGTMGSFYNAPVYHSAPRQSPNQWSGTVQPGQPWPTGKPMPQNPMMPSNNGGGSSVPPPPVTVPPVQGTGGGFTGVPGMNGTPGGYGVTLLTPPPMGSGAQWRNTMKYGA